MFSQTLLPIARSLRQIRCSQEKPLIMRSMKQICWNSTQEKPQFMVVSLLGRDRVGIVKDFSNLLAKLGGNVEQSRMASLGTEFALMTRISLKGQDASKFEKMVSEAFPGYQLQVRTTDSSSNNVGAAQAYEIQIDGPDSVGIVAKVTEELSKLEGTIIDMQTETSTAAFAGYPLFSSTIHVMLSPNRLSELQQAMSNVEELFGMEIDIFSYEEEDGEAKDA
jgi:glycine cleavage system transcriptional repressor